MSEAKRYRIKIIQPCRGSENGHEVLTFAPDGGPKGDGVYEVAENLAKAFCDEQKTAERLGLAGVVDKVKEAAGGKKDKTGGKGEGDDAKA